MFKDKNLLILSHTYNSFIKDPVEIIAKEFKKVYVLVRYQPISELSRYIPLTYFKSRIKYSKKQSIDLTNLPSNIEVIPIPLWYLPFKKSYFSVGKQHAKIALKVIEERNIKFDLIHSHFVWSAGYAGMKIKEKYKKPLLMTAHGYDIRDLPHRSTKLKNAITDVLKNADRIFTVSQKNNEYLIELGRKDAKILSNGYSSSLFYFKSQKECRKKLDLSINQKIILTVGSLELVKGYDYLIDALKVVKKKYPDILCLHIGGGALESKLKARVQSLGLEKNYKFLGRIPHHELLDYYGACDIFASSSLSEGNPTVMFETLACGKPFIGTTVGGVPDIINSQEYGILCKPMDVEGLAENILSALDREWDSKKILRYSEQFSWEKICKEILKIYEEVIL